jgi:hypothetical protein
MRLLAYLMGDQVIETETFYWNLKGTDEDMPNFWYKPSNIQMEWYRDDPGRAPFSNREDSFDLAYSLLLEVREDYDNYISGK